MEFHKIKSEKNIKKRTFEAGKKRKENQVKIVEKLN